MALTLTEQFRATVGGNRVMMFSVVQDETTSTISAASIDLKHIKSVVTGNHHFASTPADMSTLVNYLTLSITGNQDELTILLPAKVGSKFTMWVAGW